MKRSLLSLTTLLIALISCSIKEDRGSCPCYAYVNIDEFLEAGFHDALISFSAGDLLYRDRVRLAPYEGCGIEQEMPRRKAKNAVIGGIKKCLIKNDSLIVAYGSEYDPIWLYSENLNCSSDRVFVEAVPQKQYCNMNIIVSGMAPEDESTFGFRVKASCNGMDMYSHSVLEGPYCALAKQNASFLYSVRIPRQKESINMSLEIFDTTIIEEEKIYDKIDLAEMFLLAGYDWNSANLMDISVLADFSCPNFKIEIVDWKDNSKYVDAQI